MSSSIFVQYSTSMPAVVVPVPASVPAIEYNMPSDESYREDLNADALDLAVPDDDEYGMRENADSCAQILAPLVKALKYYALQGKSPVRVQSVSVVGRLVDGQWTFFLPSSGIVMRCDSDLSFGSQVFEAVPGYLALATEALNDSAPFPYPPWQFNTSFLSGFSDEAPPAQREFWTLHIKTAEVI